MFKVGDIVYTPEYPDTKYMEEWGVDRWHRNFFGKVIEVVNYPNGEINICVDFGDDYGGTWTYSESELRPASELKNMTLEEISNKFGLVINGVYSMYVNQANKEH